MRDSATLLFFFRMHFICFFKQLPVYNCRMMIFQANPFCFIIQNSFMASMHTTTRFAPDSGSNINLIPDNCRYCRRAPVFLLIVSNLWNCTWSPLDNFCSSQVTISCLFNSLVISAKLVPSAAIRKIILRLLQPLDQLPAFHLFLFIAISGIYRKACTISRSCLQC